MWVVVPQAAQTLKKSRPRLLIRAPAPHDTHSHTAGVFEPQLRQR